MDLKECLEKHPCGKVIDYKITDGTEIGLILKLNNGDNIWVFKEEIAGYQNSENIELSFSKISIKKSPEPTYNNDIYYVINPMNFANWLFNSLKDI